MSMNGSPSSLENAGTPHEIAEATQFCCLHVVTGDWNLEDEHVSWCLSEAEKRQCAKCIKAATMLRGMTLAERVRFFRDILCSCCMPRYVEYLK